MKEPWAQWREQREVYKNAPVFLFDFDVDKEWLLDKALQETRKQFYHHGRKEERVEGYTYAHVEYPELKELVGRFGLAIQGKWNMKFVYIAPNTIVDWHKDWGTQCAFNWVINGNTAAIKYRDRPYAYKSAIINTQEEHMVNNNDKERILFKISIFDRSYEETCKQFSSQFL
tara:strand:+ start:1861 stop:2376 length:516 start_codon:yes stop_codon:yes gene_type:complete